MELAVARDSPLGQYLAGLCELDGAPGGSGFAAELHSHSVPKAPAKPRAFSIKRPIWALYSTIRMMLKRIVLRAELQNMEAVHRVLDEAWPSWRDEHVVEMLGINTQYGPLLLGEMVAHADSGVKSFMALVMPIFVAACTSHLITSPRWISACFPIVAAVLGVLASCELAYQLAIGRICRQVRNLHLSVRSLLRANSEFESSFQASFDVIKKAELTSRGYRIGGTFLPPIGRLEKAADRLKCRELRCLLRTLNDQLIQFSSSGFDKNIKLETVSTTWKATSDRSDDEANAPSLLVTALSKRHGLAAMLFENATRSALLQLVLPLWEAQRDEQAESTQLKMRMAACQYQIDTCRQWFQQWQAILARQQLAVGLPAEPEAFTPSGGNNDVRVNETQSSDQKDRQRIESQLQELFAACETLSGLVTSARHELHSVENWEDEMVIDRLVPSRDLMARRVLELREAWEVYNKELGRMDTSPGKVDGDKQATSDASVIASGEPHTKQTTQPKSDEDTDKFTYVFTGTSTGEKDFDLKAILRQQEEAKPVGAFFVRELRDVLAYREANTQIITKEVDRDAGDSANTLRHKPLKAFPPVAHRQAAVSAIDLGASLKSELQNLKLPFVGDDDEVLSDGLIEED